MVYHKEHNKTAENDLSIRSSAAEYLTYIASTGNTDESIEIRYEDENIRLTQKMMAVLYDVEAHTINYHIKKILEDNELNENSTIRKFRIVQNEGERTVSRQVEYYNLELVTSVGYRVYTHALLFFTNSSLMKRKVAFAYNKHNELLK